VACVAIKRLWKRYNGSKADVYAARLSRKTDRKPALANWKAGQLSLALNELLLETGQKASGGVSFIMNEMAIDESQLCQYIGIVTRNLF